MGPPHVAIHSNEHEGHVDCPVLQLSVARNAVRGGAGGLGADGIESADHCSAHQIWRMLLLCLAALGLSPGQFSRLS